MPELDEHQIVRKIDNKELTLLSVDTSILKTYSYRFENGILQHLMKFSSSKIGLVFSDIIISEMTSHLVDDENRAKSSMTTAVGIIANTRGISKKDLQSSVEDALKFDTTRNIVTKRIDEFKKATNAEFVDTSKYVRIENIVAAYFNKRAPFENKKDKKHEFPDAIALHGLEAYAIEKGTLMIVVSGDKGWRDFCKSSKHLICIDDLKVAMGYFHREPSVAGSALADHIDKVDSYIEPKIIDYVQSMDMELTASSYHMFEEEIGYIGYSHFQYSNQTPFKLVSYYEKHQSYVFEADITINISIFAIFTFFVKDEGEFLDIGTEEKEKETTVKASILFTVIGDLNGDFEIQQFEIYKIEDEVNFGEVYPS